MIYALGSYPKSDLTRLETWEIMEKDNIIHEDYTEKPVIPGKIVYLWNEYCAIRSGCERITYEVINSYQNVTGIVLTLREVNTLIKLELNRPKGI